MKSFNKAKFLNGKQRYGLKVALACSLALLSGIAAAQQDPGDALGDGVCGLLAVLTGKWLFGASAVGLVAGGAPLLFGGEMTDMVKLITRIFFIAGCCIGAVGILSLGFKKYAGSSCG